MERSEQSRNALRKGGLWMRARIGAAVLTAVLALAGRVHAADPWDLAPGALGDDSAIETSNALEHGSEQVHDVEALGAIADEDWYTVGAEPRTSHEVVIDDIGGEVLPFSLERRDASGLTVLQS